MIYTLKKYLQFLLRSTNQHGVHSPFVFKFVTRCLYDNSKHEEYKKLYNYREGLLNSDEVIQVTDYGAGSRIFKSEKRKISAIAKHAGATRGRMKLLYRLVYYFRPAQILELGASVGLATYSLALPESGQVASVEGCPATAAVAKKQLGDYGLTDVKIQISDFSKALQELGSEKFDLVYFDGNHSKEATLSYFERLLPTAKNDSVWIFDDIYWSPEMTEAWEVIKQHPSVRVTVDCFWLGFVFFRIEQEKEHFKIRL